MTEPLTQKYILNNKRNQKYMRNKETNDKPKKI